jgi:ABC-type sugar transport system ATPase subunit
VALRAEADATSLFRAEGLSKAFGHVVALQDVSFELHAGEILALLGDNGAGKSTLVKIMSGLYTADAGRMFVDGHQANFHDPKAAVKAGVATVYQDLALVDTRDVAANLFLGSEFTWGPFVNRRKGRRESEKILKRIGITLPSVRIPVSMLSGGQRQGVAVARTLVHGAKIVLLDEPTAALGVSQTAQVMQLARDLKKDGRAVLIISHNLRQIWDVADRVMVLHLGRLAGIKNRSETTLDEIVRMIVYGSAEPTDSAQPVVA